VVRELRARYVVVRDRDGVDTLIPNENIITSEVINWSYSDRAIRLKLPVQVSYRDDPRKALELMNAAAAAHPRVESAPKPVGRVIRFGESGIDLELRFWIRDPEDGVNNVRSDLYLAIWDAFKEAGITIPFPQRDVNLQMSQVPSGWGAVDAM
jgi:small-conductance mechanosensitive channel